MKNRINEIRKAKSLTLDDVAARAGTTPQQVSRLEKGERRLTAEWMERISAALGVGKFELLLDDKPPPDDLPGKPARGLTPTRSARQIVEYDVSPQGGYGHEMPSFFNGSHKMLAEWSMPQNILDAVAMPGHRLAIVQVSGDSMEPDYRPGERVMVDLDATAPTPPGIFVLWDGLGLVLKRVELLMNTDPPQLKISSINSAYETYERLADEVVINGRVIGKWVWR